MNTEEAIKRIKNLIKGRKDPRGKTELDLALDMAIEALKETERNPTITSWYDFDRGYEKGKLARPQGEWVEVPKYKGFYVCSKCLERLDGDFERFEHWEMKKDNFCSVCGSDNRKRE